MIVIRYTEEKKGQNEVGVVIIIIFHVIFLKYNMFVRNNQLIIYLCSSSPCPGWMPPWRSWQAWWKRWTQTPAGKGLSLTLPSSTRIRGRPSSGWRKLDVLALAENLMVILHFFSLFYYSRFSFSFKSNEKGIMIKSAIVFMPIFRVDLVENSKSQECILSKTFKVFLSYSFLPN